MSDSFRTSDRPVSVIGTPPATAAVHDFTSAKAMAMSSAMAMAMAPAGADATLAPYQRAGGDLEDRHYCDTARMLVAFLTHSGWQGNKQVVLDKSQVPSAEKTAEELDLLQRRQDGEQQALRYDEIMSENEDFAGVFEQVANYDSYSHPYTCRLVNFLSELGYFVVQDVKGRYGRPRPSHLLPSLRPLVRVPAHPSWPAGHSAQATMIAQALTYFLLAPGGKNAEHREALASEIRSRARRIGENREFALLHYPSDTKAGEDVGKELWAMVARVSGEMKEIQNLVARAKMEWED